MSATEQPPDEIPPTGPARLDHFLRRRLSTLRLSHHEMERRGGPSRSTLHKAIAGQRLLRGTTLDRIDATVGWAPGSAAAVLDGGVPRTQDLAIGPHNENVVTVLKAATTMVDQAAELLATAKLLLHELVTDR